MMYLHWQCWIPLLAWPFLGHWIVMYMSRMTGRLNVLGCWCKNHAFYNLHSICLSTGHVVPVGCIFYLRRLLRNAEKVTVLSFAPLSVLHPFTNR
ncbi:hypothetical protein EDD85DRAFT_801142 [Armillaria nabsnona]|nr:hypothetical protein EDD85DRAFT_801142 [Armillaria nabsnona]